MCERVHSKMGCFIECMLGKYFMIYVKTITQLLEDMFIYREGDIILTETSSKKILIVNYKTAIFQTRFD